MAQLPKFRAGSPASPATLAQIGEDPRTPDDRPDKFTGSSFLLLKGHAIAGEDHAALRDVAALLQGVIDTPALLVIVQRFEACGCLHQYQLLAGQPGRLAQDVDSVGEGSAPTARPQKQP